MKDRLLLYTLIICIASSLSLPLISGCSKANNTEETASLILLTCHDNDQDGYGSPASIYCSFPQFDCDDNGPFINPGGTEGPYSDSTCRDTLDNDCDGLIDSMDTECIACSTPADCDDANPCTNDVCVASDCIHTNNSNPCDDSDHCTMNDICSLGICSGDPIDADIDTYISDSCGGNDCDDTDSNVNPGVRETCNNGRDDDCDSLIDENDPDCASPGCGDTRLGGEGELRPYPNSGAPLHETRWKAWRFQAEHSGEMYCFKVFVRSLIGDRTNDEVGYAIYADDYPGGGVGTLMVSGYVPHYNWAIIGTGDNGEYHSFPLNTAHTTREIVAGSWYWITMQSSGHANVFIERGSTNTCPSGCSKHGAEGSQSYPPPTTEAFHTGIIYENDCYGWSVW